MNDHRWSAPPSAPATPLTTVTQCVPGHRKVSVRMYVCICNAVTEDDVRGCLAAGASSAKQVKAACGMRPGCGSCTKRIFAMLAEEPAEAELPDSAAA